MDRISELLREKGIDRETFHGGMEQDERERALLKFRNDSTRILITTDLASRGFRHSRSRIYRTLSITSKRRRFHPQKRKNCKNARQRFCLFNYD